MGDILIFLFFLREEKNGKSVLVLWKCTLLILKAICDSLFGVSVQVSMHNSNG
jgi:hypothetical protein